MKLCVPFPCKIKPYVTLYASSTYLLDKMLLSIEWQSWCWGPGLVSRTGHKLCVPFPCKIKSYVTLYVSSTYLSDKMLRSIEWQSWCWGPGLVSRTGHKLCVPFPCKIKSYVTIYVFYNCQTRCYGPLNGSHDGEFSYLGSDTDYSEGFGGS